MFQAQARATAQRRKVDEGCPKCGTLDVQYRTSLRTTGLISRLNCVLVGHGFRGNQRDVAAALRREEPIGRPVALLNGWMKGFSGSCTSTCVEKSWRGCEPTEGLRMPGGRRHACPNRLSTRFFPVQRRSQPRPSLIWMALRSLSKEGISTSQTRPPNEVVKVSSHRKGFGKPINENDDPILHRLVLASHGRMLYEFETFSQLMRAAKKMSSGTSSRFSSRFPLTPLQDFVHFMNVVLFTGTSVSGTCSLV